jgi:chemotaxis family two-component system sensor kinase Cph1
MRKRNSFPKILPDLRKKAEELLAAHPETIDTIPREDMRKLIHELDIHQAELEIQNEELRRAQLELESSRAKYYGLYDFAPVAYFTLDKKGSVLEANLAGAALLDEERSLKGRPFSQYVSNQDYYIFHDHMEQLLRTKSKQVSQLSLVTTRGTPLHVQMETFPVLDEKGDVSQLLSAIVNISVQKKAELKLRKARDESEVRVKERTAELAQAMETLQTIIDHIPVMLCFFDPVGQVRLVNREFERLIGWSLDDASHMDLIESCYPDPDYREEVLAFMSEPRAPWRDFMVRTRDGKDLEISWANVWLSDGSHIAIGIDNSEWKKAERELKLTMQELERSNKELQDFAFIASHDLQEPLRKIQAFGDLVIRKYPHSLDQQGQDYLRRMQNAAARMQALIDGLLTYSRVATKAKPFTRLDLTLPAREALSDLELRIEATGATLELSELPVIEADSSQMTQLFQNLIGNAVKFRRPEESPRIRIFSRTRAGWCEIYVEDNGIGFDERHSKRIFTPFERLHGRGKYDGVGMGLAICRKIAERHGGRITARSTPGKGSTFIVTLPLKQKAAS